MHELEFQTPSITYCVIILLVTFFLIVPVTIIFKQMLRCLLLSLLFPLYHLSVNHISRHSNNKEQRTIGTNPLDHYKYSKTKQKKKRNIGVCVVHHITDMRPATRYERKYV